MKEKNLHLLLIPPVINPVSTDQAVNFIPVGLLVLLSTLEQNGLKAAIYKPEIPITRDRDLSLVARDILAHNSVALGFSTWCDSFPVSLLLAEEIKETDPDIPIIFGGPQVSILAADTMARHPAIDYVLKGEADYTLPKLISMLLEGNDPAGSSIPGLVYRDPTSREVISESPGEIVKDLDFLPVPAYEKIFEKSKVRIDAGRGCPYPCTYCTTNQFFSRKYRVKTPGRIIAEMNYCHEQLGVTGIGISHDMFTLNKGFVADFSAQMILYNNASGVSYTWTCSARTDCVTEKMLDQMRESGCNAIFFGMESGSEKIQKEIRKNLDLQEALKMIQHSVGLGMVTIVSYMAGFPGETRSDLHDTLRSILAAALAGARPQLTLLSILPGTPIYEQYVEKLQYDEIHSGFTLSQLTENMKNLVRSDPKIFSSFYHLPNEHISRQTYLFLADLVNNLEHFLPTLVLIREQLQKDAGNMDFVRQIEDNLDKYQYGPDTPLPELYFLTDSLKKYLEYLIDKGLPPYAWDVFQVDFTKAFMIAKFEHWQAMGSGLPDPLEGHDPDPKDMMIPRPYWKLINTQCYIFDYSHDPIGLKEKAKFRKGNYHYIVQPISHRMARLIKVPRKLVQTYSEIKESTVGEFIRKNIVILGEDKSRKTLRNLVRWGLVDIEKND